MHTGFNIWSMRSHTHTSAHAYNTKKASLVWLKNLWGVRQLARLKQRFLYPTFYKIQRSYMKIMSISYFIDSVVKIALYLNFLYTKDNRLRQIKKKNEWWNICFSDVLLIVLTRKFLLFSSFWYKIISCFK